MLQYIVQPGDTLYFIGLKFKTTVDTLMEINHITNPQMVFPGQILNIPLHFSPTGDTSSFPDIKKGSTGPFVVLVQSQLSRLGFYKGEMDGIFGAITEGSLVQFQISRTLHPTGHVSIPTWRQLLDDTKASLDSPPFHSAMVLSGVFMLLSVDKPIYAPGETVYITFMKVNLSNKTVTLNYNTSQRYEFKLTYPSGRTLWRWSDDKSFTQALGTLVLAPGQSVRYAEHFELPSTQRNGHFHVFSWNTAKQIDHIKLHLTIKTTSK